MTETLLRTLHSPRRREILRLCWSSTQRAGDIHRALGDVTFGAVSQHLRQLHDAGLLALERHGRERRYRAVRTALGPLRRWLEQSWDDALYELKLQAELEASRRGPPATGRSKKNHTAKPSR
ncbi:MAG: winged helix-turn-helix domain-containing protein [Planctomycetota bacterium]